MISKVYSIFDDKSGLFSAPTLYVTSGVAIRMFSEMVNDATTHVGKHPADYTLFELGVFDDNTGVYKPHQKMDNLGCALQYWVNPSEISDMFDRLDDHVNNEDVSNENH